MRVISPTKFVCCCRLINDVRRLVFKCGCFLDLFTGKSNGKHVSKRKRKRPTKAHVGSKLPKLDNRFSKNKHKTSISRRKQRKRT